ncbi:glucuronate isomerase [Halalkalibacter krulwichiae]|uniref:Uronate isomerase n=1 Tax=Halalkalibacter krulwichiae TaxID=199441 RepID=A0A1X9MCW7_9BACI|nr:glucuronate isomerase [Halalkalibacter krulwichiae]ARK31258.1 Uronate isomerase [Halalkalibacter krulwichiae]
MKQFLGDDFLLKSETAQKLYEKSKVQPIHDFHCHLDPKEIWEDKPFENMTQVWLAGDHYKWRAMRLNGISEHLITGDSSDWEKFEAWAETVPNLIGNPLYHWTHMELKTFFGIEKVLTPETALEIWEECNEKLQHPDFSPRKFVERSNVQFIGTTDDPISMLEYHELLTNDEAFTATIAPTFRPDGALFLEKPTFHDWLKKLESVSGQVVTSLDELLVAMKQRVDFFDQMGCRASDHGLSQMVYKGVSKVEAEEIFAKRFNGNALSDQEIVAYQSFLLLELGKMYAEKKWVMQLHIGAIRNNNTKMFHVLGADSGFDSIGDARLAEGLAQFLDALDQVDALPKTILYNLNPRDNYVLATMTGNFYEAGIPGKVQFGSAWWFNDHIDGMEKQLKDLGNLGLLSHFVGMLTDSRSLLSFVRHDYFRRILCNLIGEWVEDGKAPSDHDSLERMVENISFNNAKRYFA